MNIGNQYHILDGVQNSEFAWDEVKNTTLNAVWNKIWPECCIREAIVDMPALVEIVKMGKKIGCEGFDDTGSEDISEVIERAQEDLSVEEMVTYFADNNVEKDESDDTEIVEEKKLSSKAQIEFLKIGNQLGEEAINLDPDLERALIFRRRSTETLAPYEELYNSRDKKQSLLTSFFYKTLGGNIIFIRRQQ